MKLKKTKLLSLIMAAALVFESAGMNVVAASNTVNDQTLVYSVEEVLDVTDGDVSASDVTEGDVSEGDVVETPVVDVTEGDVTEGNVEVPVEDVTEGDVDVTEGDVTEGDVEEPVVDVTEGDVTEGDVSDGDVTEGTLSLKELFPGLPASYKLSAEQMNDKAVLAEYANDVAVYENDPMKDYYVDRQVVYLTESEEEAQIIAEAFGGELDSFYAGVAVIKLTEDRTVAQAVAASASAEIKLPAVWPNYYRETHAVYNDPALKDLGGAYQWHHEYVGSPVAWQSGYTGSGVKVAVIDTGILNAHEEFSGRLVLHQNATGGSATADTDTSTAANSGHGTHVSGIIAANKNNGKGGVGVAPDASLYVYDAQAYDSEVGTYVITSAAIMRGVNQAAQNKIDIVNMSLGGPTYNADEEKVMKSAYEAGVTIFASAGNDSTTGTTYPAQYDGVYSVAALQQDGAKTGFSNYGNWVDFAFPGYQIYSSVKASTSAYDYMSGTSQASPVAAGVAAVILSGASDLSEFKGKDGNMLTGSKKVDALISVMKKNAKKSSSKGTGAGTTQLDKVFGSVKIAAPTFNLSNKNPLAVTSTTVRISCATTKGITIYYSTNGKTPSFKKGVVTNATGTVANGGSVTIGGAKSVTLKAIAVNHATGKASKVTSVTYKFAPNPTAVAITSVNGVYKLAKGKSVQLKATVTPSYAVSTKVAWSVADATKANGVTVSKSGKVSVAKDAVAGTYNVFATAVDAKGNAIYNGSTPVEKTFAITVLSDSLITKIAFDKKATEPYKTVYRSNTADSIPLAETVLVTYADKTTKKGTSAGLLWSSNNTSVATVNSAGTVTVRGAGKATIKVLANDGSNKSATFTITVNQYATSVSVSGSSTVLAAGKSMKLTAKVNPYPNASQKVTWNVAPAGTVTGKVTVKNGKVTASRDASGTWRVDATATDGSGITSNPFNIKILASAITQITMDKSMTLFVPGTGKTYQKQLSTTIAGGSNVAYTSSNTKVATVSSTGLVTAVGKGTATITCAATDGSGKKATCKVTVNVPMSSLKIIPGDVNDGYVYEGSSMQLKAVVGDDYGTPSNSKVKWTVSNSDCITVSSSGVVKAKKNCVPEGYIGTTAMVYATAMDGSGLMASYQVVIYKAVKRVNTYNMEDGYVYVTVDTADGKYYYSGMPFYVEVSAPKGHNVAITQGYDADLGVSWFYVLPEEPTTTKKSTETLYYSDGIYVTIKVKLQGCNKSTSMKMFLLKTSDNKYIWE